MNRKKFLSNLTFAGIGISSIGINACGNQSKKNTTSSSIKVPFFKISLAQWSINRMIKNGDISPYDFARLGKKWGFEGLEFVNTLYDDVMKASNKSLALKKFIVQNNQLANQYEIENLLIMIDEEGDLSSEDKNTRLLAIENHKPWIEASNKMGCHSIRVNLNGSFDNVESWKLESKESLSYLCDYALNYDINIIVENHGGFSSDADLLMNVITDVNRPNCGTLPDFGNFCISNEWGASSNACSNEYDKYLGVTKMMSKAFAVSAKSYDFDVNGDEKVVDYKKMLEIVKNANYSGFIGVEYEGPILSEEEGVQATKNLLLKYG
jgi:sugar phosphate isomerase/epimerase